MSGSKTSTDLIEKIQSRDAVIAVVGLGYVGLPLGVVFAEAGFQVVGIDLDETRVDGVNGARSHISDIAPERLAAVTSGPGPASTLGQPAEGRRGRLRATTDFEELKAADAAIVCVPTPLSKTRDPDLSFIISAADEIARRLGRGMLVVLESTTYPGTTEEVILPRLSAATLRGARQGPSRGLDVGSDFFLAFSPERIDPGRDDWTVSNTPKVMGGVTPACLEVARALYETAVEQVVPVSSPKVAEMVKLLENTFRATNVALVNEMAIMCSRLGVDIWEVIGAAETKPFGFMPFYPGPGLGGHCIPVDPQYLAWKLKTLNYNARFIQLADEVNLGMPAFVLGKITDALNDELKPLKGSRLLVLGVAYKADVGDTRESPALDLIELLMDRGADVTYHDPHVDSLDLNGRRIAGSRLDAEALREADCVVIVTAHTSYDWAWVVRNSSLVVDTRNATAGAPAGAGRVVKL
jgi:UDP-N-acetyl-D-glucosamine dehydrogenase